MAAAALDCDDHNTTGVRVETDRNKTSNNDTTNASSIGPDTTTNYPKSGGSSLTGQTIEVDTSLRRQTVALPPKLGWKSGVDGGSKSDKESGAASRKNMITESNGNESAVLNSTPNNRPSTTTLANTCHPPSHPLPVIEPHQASPADHSSDKSGSSSRQVSTRSNTTNEDKMPTHIPMPPYNSEPPQNNAGSSKAMRWEKFCEICGVGHDGTYGSGRFCTSRCARTMGGLARMKKKGSVAEHKEGSISKNAHNGHEQKKQQGKGSKKTSYLNELLENHIANHPNPTEPATPAPDIVPCPVRGAVEVTQEYERVPEICIAGDGAPGESSSMRTKAVIGVGSTIEHSESRRKVKKKHGGIPIKALLNPVIP